jgi:hypothetical protein
VSEFPRLSSQSCHHDTPNRRTLLRPATSSFNELSSKSLYVTLTDPGHSLSFYVAYCGMSVFSTFNAGPFTIYYLGYPIPTDASQADTLSPLVSQSGLLQLLHIHGSPSSGFQTTPDGLKWTLGRHLVTRISVPNAEDALKLGQDAGLFVPVHTGDLGLSPLASQEYQMLKAPS